MPDRRFSLGSARRAADEGRVAEWVGEFLASPGSDNATLAAALSEREHRWWGPVQVPVDALERLAGPEDEVLVPIGRAEWEDDIEAMEESLEEGWAPPPLLVEWNQGALLLQDGNHRYEAQVREGARAVWVFVYSDDPGAPVARDLARLAQAVDTSPAPLPPSSGSEPGSSTGGRSSVR